MRTKSLLHLAAVFLLISIIISTAFVELLDAKSVICTRGCKARCKKLKGNWSCEKKCNLCCSKCRCVPPYGSKRQCPCYREIVGYPCP